MSAAARPTTQGVVVMHRDQPPDAWLAIPLMVFIVCCIAVVAYESFVH
jgi:hypothetical protein